jgi:hypothetical protein
MSRLHQHSGYAHIDRGRVVEQQQPHRRRQRDASTRPRRELLLDVLLAFSIGTALAAVLFLGWSGGFRP